MHARLKFLLSLLFVAGSVLVSCKKEFSCEGGDCANQNKPPIAIAGPDQVITLPVDSAFLNGSGSSDPDGMIVRYGWKKIAGPAANLLRTADSITVVTALTAGIFQFELEVTVNGGLSAKDTVRILVDSVATSNHAPIANAGPDQVIVLPVNAIDLDGSASGDPENNITGYLWTKISGPPSAAISTPNAVQTPVLNLVQGIYLFELKVTDAGGLFSQDTLQVIVDTTTTTNLPPIALAGNDTTIQTNQTTCTPIQISLTLNGSHSYDTDGSIQSHLWSGPHGIVNPNTAITTMSGLASGTLRFVLKVTDNRGAVGFDTLNVSIVPANRPLVPVQVTQLRKFTEWRSGVAVAAVGDKLFFAGGTVAGAPASTKVEIYNTITGTWASAQLSAPRFWIGTASSGTKVYFAGGVAMKQDNFGNWFLSDTYQFRSSVIDIYDVSTNTWSIDSLSTQRAPVGASVNNKVVFAGSDVSYQSPVQSGVIDNYNTGTGTLSSTAVSEIRDFDQPAITANKIYFAGGSRDLGRGSSGLSGGLGYKSIDIYDAVADTWTMDTLSRERMLMGNIIANNKLYSGGGLIWDTAINSWNTTNSVEIKDLLTNTISFDCLSEARAQVTALRRGNSIYFFGTSSTSFDIFDIASGKWSIGVLPQFINPFTSFICYKDIIYFTEDDQVWKVDF